MKPQDLIDYLDINSADGKAVTAYTSVLQRMIKGWVRAESIQISPTDFNELVEAAKALTTDLIPYAQITRIVYLVARSGESGDGLDVLETDLNKKIRQLLSDSEITEVENYHVILIKTLEHIKLANSQLDGLYKTQEQELLNQQTKVDEVVRRTAQLDSRIQGFDKQTNQLNDDISDLEDRAGELEDKNDHMTFDYIAILGIFTSITFATFGGIQLLGNVFGNLKHVGHVDVGNKIMLGAIFLFGTYLILISLLLGISKLTGKDYRLSLTDTRFIFASFLLIFAIGLLYANQTWLIPVYDWLKQGNHDLWLLTMVVLFLAGIVGYLLHVIRQEGTTKQKSRQKNK